MARLQAEPKLPRREFIRTASGLILVGTAELVIPGCPGTQQQVAEVIVTVFATLLREFLLPDEIRGDLAFSNAGSSPIRFEGVLSLIEKFSNDTVADQSDPQLYSIPPGGMSYGWGDLWATHVGTHVVALLFGGSAASTSPFEVRG